MRYIFPFYCALLVLGAFVGGGHLQSVCAVTVPLALVTSITWLKWLPRLARYVVTYPVVALAIDVGLFYLGMKGLDTFSAKATFVAWHAFVSTGLLFEYARLHLPSRKRAA